MSVLIPEPYCLDDYGFVVLPEVWMGVMPPAWFMFLRIALAILGLLCFQTNFKIFFSSSAKSAISNLIETALNL